MKYTSKSLEQTQKIAEDFVSSVVPNSDRAVVVGLYGNLGSGKTTLTQFIAQVFGVKETVTSPTFVIEKIYELTAQKFSHLIHVDAYRIENSHELLHLGWDDIVSDPHNFVLVEWPEKVADIMPRHIKIKLNHMSENSREIEVIE